MSYAALARLESLC